MLEYFSTIILVITMLVILYLYIKYCIYSYWKKHNIPYETPSVPLGNIPLSYFSGYSSIGDLMKASYNKFKTHRFHGFFVFYKPILVVNDPELVKAILIKDFSKFTDRGWFFDVKVDPLSDNLFFQPGQKWRRLREKFSPTFMPQKLRNIHVFMEKKSKEMIRIMNKEIKTSRTIEIINVARRYTTDVICSVVYGLDTGCLKNLQSDFHKLGIKIADFGKTKQLLAMFLPEILEKITLPLFQTEVKNIFVDIFKDVVDKRRRKNIIQKDMLNLLIQLVDNGRIENEGKTVHHNAEDSSDADKISMMEAAAQAFIFLLSGIETSSSTISHCLLEIAFNPDIQEKLQREIDKVYESPKGVTYDTLMEMQYLKMVIMETMRKYSPVSMLSRMAVEDYRIPDSDFVIPKGMRIVISTIGIHKDPKYYPDPEKFDPSRHTKEKVAARHPCLDLSFGKGSRDCIGKRYGLLQVKQAVVAVLRYYNIRVSDKTRFPITFNTENFIQQPTSGIHLDFESRRKVH